MGFFDRPEEISPSSGDSGRLAALEQRVARLEQQVAELLAAVPAVRGGAGAVPAAAPWLAEVQALKDRGKLIHAIKLYREHTGVGLAEAKTAVESLPG